MLGLDWHVAPPQPKCASPTDSTQRTKALQLHYDSMAETTEIVSALERDLSRANSSDSGPEEPRTPKRKRSSYESRFVADLGPYHDIGFFVGPMNGKQQASC